MNFQETSKEGVIFNPKIYVADFCHYRRYFGHEFQKKIATQLSENEGGAGGQRPFGTFPKIHPFWKGNASLRLPRLQSPTSAWPAGASFAPNTERGRSTLIPGASYGTCYCRF